MRKRLSLQSGLSADESPVLLIGTDVSAKYKGAFCEAKIKKINRNVKCKVTVRQTNSAVTVDDELITGTLRVGAQVVLKQNSQSVDAVIAKILDQSLYTVVFDDGDEATLKRTSLCLKSGKHFAESETLDQLPLTNPEHFGNPVPNYIEEEVETSEEFDSALDDSDDEQSEEKDRFVAQLYKYMDERGTPINRAPSVGGKDLNLYKLYRIVVKMGGYNRVTNKNSWRAVYAKLGLPQSSSAPGKDSSAVYQLKSAYKKFLHSFDDFYRKLGCTITVNSRTSRPSRGERIQKERTVTKKSATKKERDSKKEDQKEERDTKEAKEPKESKDPVVVSTSTPEVVPKEVGKAKERERERAKDREKEKEKEIVAKEEPKPIEDIRSVAKESKESNKEIKVKAEETTPLDERKRGRGRKRREEPNDGPPADEDTMTGQSTIDESEEEDHKSGQKNTKVDESMIKVGDGLKVKYGRGRQLKVYEAKVLKIELDAIKNKNKYFVHYSGWNSRYDEWIKKSRIVQLLRDRSPRRRSGKLKNKGEPLAEPPNSGTQNTLQTPVMFPSISSQNSVSSVTSSDSAFDTNKQSPQPPKRGRPPNSGKSVGAKEPPVLVKEEPKSQSSQEKPTQASSQSTAQTVPTTPVGRRGRPPLSSKREKLTRSKSLTGCEDQTTNESFATSSIADESINKPIDDKKNSAIVSSDNEVSDKTDEKDQSEEDVPAVKAIEAPELHDENTVENQMVNEEEVVTKEVVSPLSVKVEQMVEEVVNKTVVPETDDSANQSTTAKPDVEDKSEDLSSPVKDAFDFEDDEEVAKEEEPLKEQLKKKRKTKDSNENKKSNNKSTVSATEKTKEITNEDNNNVREIRRTNSISRKASKKSRKSNVEPIVEKTVVEEVVPTEEVPKAVPIKVEEEKTSTAKAKLEREPTQTPVIDTPKPETTVKTKRKGRKRKDSESVAPVKKKVKPSKLELHEEDSNLEVQKLFEQSYGSSTPPPESDISPVEEMKVLPNFTTDIHPSQPESVSTSFLLCEEAVPASPEKAPQPEEHMDDSSPLQESPHSYHSSPTQSPTTEDATAKEAKGSGGSNSENENEPIVTKDETNKIETFPSPTHDEDSMISRPECSKSPVSPKKRRRGRIRTVSQSDSIHHKERIGCKTRGSTGRHKAERHSPLTALEHRLPFPMTQISFQNFIPESKYNFCEPLDESIDADRRINILQERLQELRKTYMNIKKEVAVLDRKKKRARRKEREKRDTNNSSAHKHSSNHSHNNSNSADAFGHSLHNNNNSSKHLNDSNSRVETTVPLTTSATSCLTTTALIT